MNRVRLDDDICRQLVVADHSVELCDAHGRVIGFFLPARCPSGRLPAGLPMPFTSAEIAALRGCREGRSLDAILRTLGDDTGRT